MLADAVTTLSEMSPHPGHVWLSDPSLRLSTEGFTEWLRQFTEIEPGSPIFQLL